MISNQFLLVKFRWIPIVFIIFLVGTIFSWATSLNHASNVRTAASIVKPNPVVFPIKEIFVNLNEITPYLLTAIPTVIAIAIRTVQFVESARRTEDFYATREAMFADGIGTLIASLIESILGMASRSI